MLHTRSDEGFFNLARVSAKSKILKVADDTVLTARTGEGLQRLITCFDEAHTDSGLKIKANKIKFMCDNSSGISQLSIGGNTLGVVNNFTYLESDISSNFSLKHELTIRIRKAVNAMAGLVKRVWTNAMLTLGGE